MSGVDDDEMTSADDNELSTLIHFSAFDKESWDARNNALSQPDADIAEENISKRIRSILDLSLRNVIVEVIFTLSEDEYFVTMRGLFHCHTCLKLWNTGKRNIGFQCGENSSIAPGDTVQLKEEEAMYVIKLLIDACYTSDPSMLQVLNRLHDGDGEFCVEPINDCRDGWRNTDFSPLLFISPSGRRISGTFIFSPDPDSESSCIYFSPKFNVASRLRGSTFENLIVSIFADDDIFCLRAKKKQLFSLANGELIDMKRIFTSGLLASCSNRYFFFSGKMKRDAFFPSTLISDTGILYRWPKESSKRGRVKFRNVKEIFDKTKLSFPAFPCRKISQDNCKWTFVKDRRVVEVPSALLQAEEKEYKAGVATLYLGGELDEERTLRPKTKLHIPSSKYSELRISPKSGRFEKLIFEGVLYVIPEVASILSSRNDVLSTGVVVQPSGIPVIMLNDTNDNQQDLDVQSPTTSFLKNFKDDRSSVDSFSRTPSIVSLREFDPSEDMALFQQRTKNLHKGNQNVLNPAVKNRTGRPIKLGSLTDGRAPAKQGGDTTQLDYKSAVMNKRYEATVMLTRRFQGSDTVCGGSQPANRITNSNTGVENRVSKRTLDASARRGIVLSESCIKYDFTKQDPLTQGGSKTSKPTVGIAEKKVPLPKRRSRKAPVVGSTTQERKKNPVLEDKRTEILDDFFLSDDEEDINISDLSSFSDVERGDKKMTNKNSHLPFLDGFTVLKFTQNFRFSYFMMPGYVKEKNKNIKNGILQLPIIKENRKGSLMANEKPKARAGSRLMKKIEKLNRYGAHKTLE